MVLPYFFSIFPAKTCKVESGEPQNINYLSHKTVTQVSGENMVTHECSTVCKKPERVSTG